jgi:hypothetical protein
VRATSWCDTPSRCQLDLSTRTPCAQVCNLCGVCGDLVRHATPSHPTPATGYATCARCGATWCGKSHQVAPHRAQVAHTCAHSAHWNRRVRWVATQPGNSVPDTSPQVRVSGCSLGCLARQTAPRHPNLGSSLGRFPEHSRTPTPGYPSWRVSGNGIPLPSALQSGKP